MSQKTTLVKNKEVFELLQDAGFQKKWKQLATQSVGFTKLQENDFLTTWYQLYQSLFDPILIFSQNEKNELVGLIALAWDKEKQKIAHAGNAEYHGWLAIESETIPFLKSVLEIVKNDLGVKKWSWNWMSSGLDAASLKTAADGGVYFFIEEQESPIWNLLDEEKLKKSLKSRSLKSKINRYKRRGEYRFEMIKDSNRVREVLDIAQHQCDFRREAVNNNRPFAEDQFKIDFAAELVEIPKTIHVSALWLDDQLLACHVGSDDGNRVCFGMISYDPSESKQSPGTLMIVELAKQLKEDGYTMLDMTPGTNSYKDRFANSYEKLYRPAIFFSQKEYLKAKAKNAIKLQSKKMLKLAKVDVPTMRKWKADAKDWSNKLKTFPKSIFSVFGNTILKKKRIQFHQVDLEKIIQSDNINFPIDKQKYTDLLLYKDNQPFNNRRELLQVALRKFSKGEVLFSKSKNGRLEWFCWMKEVKGEIEIEGSSETVLMDDGDKAKVLYDFYTSSNMENTGFEESVLEVIPHIDLSENEKIWLATEREKDFSFS
jgi:hypothetical protein